MELRHDQQDAVAVLILKVAVEVTAHRVQV